MRTKTCGMMADPDFLSTPTHCNGDYDRAHFCGQPEGHTGAHECGECDYLIQVDEQEVTR